MYKSLSSELLNWKITDTLNNMTHQESNVDLNDLLNNKKQATIKTQSR